MTRHALAQHAPRGAIFAVSSYGRGRHDGRPPAELHPLGLEGPLGWLAEQLEARDEEQLEWLWDLAPDDLPRLARCVAAYEQRYPRSDRRTAFPARLERRWRRFAARGGRCGMAAGRRGAGRRRLAGYDVLGFQHALAFERPRQSPRRRSRSAGPSCSHGTRRCRSSGRQARQARQSRPSGPSRRPRVQVANGTAAPDLPRRSPDLKDQAPAARPGNPQGRGRPEQPATTALEGRPGRGPRAGRRRPRTPLAAVQSFLQRVSRHAPPRRGPGTDSHA